MQERGGQCGGAGTAHWTTRPILAEISHGLLHMYMIVSDPADVTDDDMMSCRYYLYV